MLYMILNDKRSFWNPLNKLHGDVQAQIQLQKLIYHTLSHETQYEMKSGQFKKYFKTAPLFHINSLL